MPIYTYKGYDIATGAVRKGKIEADSLRSARQKLRSKEKVISSELKEEIALDKAKERSTFLAPRSVPLQEISIMTRQFSTLQRAHVPLDESLKALTQQVDHVLLRNCLAAVKDSVSEGKSLAEATSEFPHIFSKLYINMVRAGESSGTLGLVLERLADFQEYQVKVKGQIFSAMSYPIIMILASFGIISYLFISVVPKLQKVFASLKVTLPWYTKILIGISEFVQMYWYLILAGMALTAFLFQLWYKSEAGRKLFDRFILVVPLFGAIVLRVNVSKFTKTLSTLLTSGVPIITALEITRNIIGNSVLAEVLSDAKQAVQEGQTLGAVIEQSGRFPPLVIHMIRTGEKTGELEQMLTHVSNAYDAEVERKISSLISLIEPLMIIVMGGIVVVVVIAMLVPMLSVMNQMR